MNLSGNAVDYWLKKENIPLENMLVIVDDLALPLGSIRMRPKGSDGGHNGLAHINTILAQMNIPESESVSATASGKDHRLIMFLGNGTMKKKNSSMKGYQL